ncbi:ScbR family autoregulator-binding transcription factor [Mycolicibacterium sp. CBMA 226]|uniref:ScbR family autoregulator-binding transcription factor n=1 Tax=Mycolicibacterium sp. CBMA 226 TaxID=2606611 RepID=UPI0012DE57D0|nr:ScbR family autoregulator-binding transcription factor [Mycolicibacterium sp. CBMA 226]MUL78677.1 TetR/AcrR family transcriptional regulator [Mycolicibacterium sp. CBMA 226]
MRRQPRSEVTRRKLVDATIDLINEIGYPAAGLADIVERAGLTKGALYYHFDSKEALATVIIEEGMVLFHNIFQSAPDSKHRAFESLIVGTFTTADLFATNGTVRAGVKLLRTFAGFNPTAKLSYLSFVEQITGDIKRAAAEGDLRQDTDPTDLANTVVAWTLGAELLSSSVSDGHDFRDRLARQWRVLMPAIAAEESLDAYQAFVVTASATQSNLVEAPRTDPHRELR